MTVDRAVASWKLNSSGKIFATLNVSKQLVGFLRDIFKSYDEAVVEQTRHANVNLRSPMRVQVLLRVIFVNDVSVHKMKQFNCRSCMEQVGANQRYFLFPQNS